MKKSCYLYIYLFALLSIVVCIGDSDLPPATVGPPPPQHDNPCAPNYQPLLPGGPGSIAAGGSWPATAPAYRMALLSTNGPMPGLGGGGGGGLPATPEPPCCPMNNEGDNNDPTEPDDPSPGGSGGGGGGGEPDPEKPDGDPIFVMTGNNQITEYDLLIPCPTIDLMFERVYQNMDTDNAGIGHKWHHNYDWRIVLLSNIPMMNVKSDYLAADGEEFSANDFITPVPSQCLDSFVFKDCLVMQAVCNPLDHGADDFMWFPRDEDGSFSSPNQYQAEARSNGCYRIKAPGCVYYDFDATGLFTNIAHRNGQSISLQYDDGIITNMGFERPRLVRVQHSNGQYLDFSYQDSLLSEIATPVTNYTLTFSYNDFRDLTNVTRTLTRGTFSTTYEYLMHNEVSTHLLTKRIRDDGYEFNYQYEESLSGSARAVGMYITPDLFQSRIDYVNNHHTRAYSHRDGRELVKDYYYDPVLRLYRAVVGPNNTNWVEYFSFNDQKDVQSNRFVDYSTTNWCVLRMEHDRYHNPTNYAFGYNALPTNGCKAKWDTYNIVLKEFRDPLNRGVTIDYDRQRALPTNIAIVGDALRSETRLFYNDHGLIIAITNANGESVQWDYNMKRYPSTLFIPGICELSATYDTLGYVTNLTLPGWNGTCQITIENSKDGLPLSVILPDGTENQYSYDARGRMTETVDALSRTSTITYLLGDVSSISRYCSEAQTQAAIRVDYDTQMNQKRICDELNRNVETYYLDDANRVTNVLNIEAQEMAIKWSVANFVDSIIRFDGSTIQYFRDDEGRVAQQRIGSLTNAYVYEANGLLISAANEFGTVSNGWNGLNRLVSAKQAVPSSGLVQYAYFPAGQISNISYVAGNVFYSNDIAGRITEIHSPEGSFAREYSTNTILLEKVTCPNGMYTFYGMDIMNRVTNIVWSDNLNNVLRSCSYQYNPVGMITNTVLQDGTAVRYTYDSLDRLIGEYTIDTNGAIQTSASYSYDLAGNRLSMTRNAQTVNYLLDVGNKLSSWSGGGAIQYDAGGNMERINYSATNYLTFTWNDRYQMTHAFNNGTQVEQYAYDVIGRRTMIAGADGTNYLVYAGMNVIAEVDGQGNLLKSYTHGPGDDNILAMQVYGETETNTYYYLKDYLGSVIGITDENGNLVESYTYDAWGNVSVYDATGTEIAVSAIGNRYTFQGREISWASGLYYFRARWYDASVGRWLSKDPIGIAGGLNQYVFCNDNPVKFVDPNGELPVVPVLVVGGAIVMGYGIYKLGDWFDRMYYDLYPEERIEIEDYEDAEDYRKKIRDIIDKVKDYAREGAERATGMLSPLPPPAPTEEAKCGEE